jgi:hypothetical protein
LGGRLQTYERQTVVQSPSYKEADHHAICIKANFLNALVGTVVP